MTLCYWLTSFPDPGGAIGVRPCGKPGAEDTGLCAEHLAEFRTWESRQAEPRNGFRVLALGPDGEDVDVTDEDPTDMVQPI